MNHQNPYTGYSYKNDSAIVAVELNNEPDHTANVPDKTVTAYIDRLAKAVRTAGCRKPIVYNITQNPERSQAVTTARIDGVSGQWYPSGLVGGKNVTKTFCRPSPITTCLMTLVERPVSSTNLMPRTSTAPTSIRQWHVPSGKPVSNGQPNSLMIRWQWPLTTRITKPIG